MKSTIPLFFKRTPLRIWLFSFSFVYLAFIALSGSATGQEVKKEEQAEPEVEEEVSKAQKENAEWLENYYKNPTPDQFVERMRTWAKEGTLQNKQAHSALIAFVSQLMRQNRDQILPWAKQLVDLSKEDLIVYNTALVFSRTGEADELIQKALGDRIGEFERPPKILEIPLNEPPAMNMLWGYFYATGSESAVRKIIHGFRYENAPLAPDGAKIPEGYKPYYTELPGLAYASLKYNLDKHPKLVEICENLLTKDSTLLTAEKRNLYDLLSVRDPEKYTPLEKLTKKQYHDLFGEKDMAGKTRIPVDKEGIEIRPK